MPQTLSLIKVCFVHDSIKLTLSLVYFGLGVMWILKLHRDCKKQPLARNCSPFLVVTFYMSRITFYLIAG